jgi:sortase A
MKKSKLLYKISVCIFIISIAIVIYASYSVIYSKNQAKKNIEVWENIKKNKQNLKENEEVIEKGPESQNEKEDQEKLNRPEDTLIMGKVTGLLTIEKSKKKVPIVEGTSDEDLKGGAGHYKDSFFPGERGNCILFGHRDGVFLDLKEFKLEDIITIETIKGTFSYKVISTKVVEPKEEEIIKEYDESMLTLVTCYPFNFIGNAPKRFVVTAKLQ